MKGSFLKSRAFISSVLVTSVLCSLYLLTIYLHSSDAIGAASLWDLQWLKDNMHQVKEWGIIQWMGDLVLSFIRHLVS